jgi:hypothetical protein
MNMLLWKNVVILMAPFFGAGGPVQLSVQWFVQTGVA